MNIEEICENVFGSRPRRITPVSGGCIAGAGRIDLADGTRLFAKQTDGPDPFEAEALCLRHLKVPGGVRVPDVLHVQPNLLILEWIDFAPPRADSQARLGEQLAVTHRKTDSAFGFPLDHVIGATPQKNLPRIPDGPGAWAEFWWTHRLEPMIRRLPESLHSGFLPLENRIAPLLTGTDEPPAILHGDLWSGNAVFDTQGQPVMFDPAAYYGHREADLSMTRMFGGFTQDFYNTYNETYPLPEGWQDRLDFYMLYHVLNHVILFGNSYLPQAQRLAEKIL
jgi:protein-ribulosamine 3-kinase